MLTINQMRGKQILFTTVHQKILLEYLNEFIHSVDNPNLITLYGQISLKEAIYLFIYYIITGEGYYIMESKFIFLHSNYDQVFSKICHI